MNDLPAGAQGVIEPVVAATLDQVLPLIAEYQQFYGVTGISDNDNRKFFSQFGPDSMLGCQFVYAREGVVMGFATVYFCFSSTLASKVGVLNDLYVSPTQRGQGIGRALIDAALAYALERGAARLQWVTAPDNENARALYQSMGAVESPWIFYRYDG